MSEIVFILGAGASKAAGAPVMADFLESADQLRRSGEVEEFKSDFDMVFDAISELQKVHSKAELDLHNIESIFAAFEMGRLINKFPGISGNEIVLHLAAIRKLIWITLEKTIKYPYERLNIYPPECYAKFAQLVKQLNSDQWDKKRCSIITFNYDLALDYALNMYIGPVDYCLSEISQREHIHLMKLHGSLNWAKCSECGKIVTWDFNVIKNNSSYVGRLIELSQIEKKEIIQLSSKALPSGTQCCGKNIEFIPVIVPPTWNKTEHHLELSKVWSAAANELSEAESIFVSGYSLPESDLFFRYLFALGSVGKSLIKRFWVFDPDEKNEVSLRFEKLLGAASRSKFIPYKQTFDDAIETIAKEMRINFQFRRR